MEIDEKLKVSCREAISRLKLNGVTFSGLYWEATTGEWYVHMRKPDATYFSVIINLDMLVARTGSTDTDALTDEIVNKLQALKLAA